MADSNLDDGNDTSTLEKIAAWLGMITLGSMASVSVVLVIVFVIIPLILLVIVVIFVVLAGIGAAI